MIYLNDDAGVSLGRFMAFC